MYNNIYIKKKKKVSQTLLPARMAQQVVVKGIPSNRTLSSPGPKLWIRELSEFPFQVQNPESVSLAHNVQNLHVEIQNWN